MALRRTSARLKATPASAPDRTILHADRLPFSRTVVFAPHPDDECVGAGALIAEIASRGGALRVVFMTNGENNPWPQRAAHRSWSLDEKRQRQWGRLRRAEARRALTALGARGDCATFLGLPDGGLSALDRATLIERIAPILREVEPTLVVIPSLHDFHPDHRATHRAVVRALADRPVILSYVVHGNATYGCRTLISGQGSLTAKRAAIRCHASQLLLSSGRFRRYATRPEMYAVVHDVAPAEDTPFAAAIANVRHAMSVLW